MFCFPYESINLVQIIFIDVDSISNLKRHNYNRQTSKKGATKNFEFGWDKKCFSQETIKAYQFCFLIFYHHVSTDGVLNGQSTTGTDKQFLR